MSALNTDIVDIAAHFIWLKIIKDEWRLEEYITTPLKTIKPMMFMLEDLQWCKLNVWTLVTCQVGACMIVFQWTCQYNVLYSTEKTTFGILYKLELWAIIWRIDKYENVCLSFPCVTSYVNLTYFNNYVCLFPWVTYHISSVDFITQMLLFSVRYQSC